jgi:copper transport protein
MTVPTPPMSRARLVFAAVLATVVMALGWSGVASAHTDFDSSTPADQDVVEGPIEQVTVDFTNPATIAGEGFELLDPSGTIRTPSAIDPTDGTSFVLSFDPPLAAGMYGVRWKVRAGDAHPIDGTFTFEVTEPPPPTVPATTAPATIAPATTVAEVGATPTPDSTAPAVVTPIAPTTTSTVPIVVATNSNPTALDDFLATDDSGGDAVALGRVGRLITFFGTIFGIGSLAALVWVIRGRRDEIHKQITWIRLAGIVIATGGLIELAGLQAALDVGLREIVDTKAGLAAVLKLAGGTIIWFGFHPRAGRVIGPAHSLSAAIATDPAGPNPTMIRIGEATGEHRWSPSSSAALGLVGYAVALASFWFDGHTVSKGPWALHSLVNLVHVAAAAVWGGGVFAMTTVVWLRRRRAERVGLAEMVIRFSTLATASLTAVIVAGVAMAALILDTPGDLVATTWGRILVAKTLAVTVAAGMGAYNHFKLRPALEQSPNDPMLAKELRTSLTIESAVLAVVVILTAWLVASAT